MKMWNFVLACTVSNICSPKQILQTLKMCTFVPWVIDLTEQILQKLTKRALMCHNTYMHYGTEKCMYESMLTTNGNWEQIFIEFAFALFDKR